MTIAQLHQQAEQQLAMMPAGPQKVQAEATVKSRVKPFIDTITKTVNQSNKLLKNLIGDNCLTYFEQRFEQVNMLMMVRSQYPQYFPAEDAFQTI